MANQPTLIVASLDDSQLQQSINKLVAKVKIATHTMTTDFDSAVDHINAKLKELGTGSTASAKGGGSANTTKQSTQAVEENTDAIKRNAQAVSAAAAAASQQASAADKQIKKNQELSMSFDQMAKAQQQVINSSASAKQAFSSVMSMPMNTEEQGRAKIEALIALRQKLADTPFSSKKNLSNIENALVLLKLRFEETFGAAIDSEKRASAEAKISAAEIKELAKSIREYMSAYKADTYFIHTNNIENAIYRENDARAKGLTIEQQIEAIYKGQTESVNAATNAKNEALNAERQITEEVKKRKAYQTPTTGDSYGALQSVVANKLGIKQKEVIGFAEPIKRMQDSLKQLQDAYIRMSEIERNSPIGKYLRQSMQSAEREIQQARKEMSRPINFKDALSGSEKTLDDIAYKMQRLRAYRQSIDITKPNAANDIKQVDDALAKLQREMDKYMSKSKQVNEINTALGRSWNYMKNRLAFYFTVGATTQFIKSLVDIRGQYELLERSIDILVDSAQNGSRIFAELNAMAIKSPFTTMELGAAAKQLVAYDVAAKDVVDTTKRLADMGAAVGVPLERLTYALGQIKSYGYLNARDARMFANTGIPLVKNLADMYTKLEGRLVSTSDVYDRIKKKAISYNDVMKVVTDMTDEGGKFFNFQEKAADTLKVKIANLTLAYNNMLNEMGKDQQGVLGGVLSATKTVFEHWRDVYNTLKSIAMTLGVAKALELGILLYQKKMTAYMAVQKVLGTGIANALRTMKGLFMTLLTPIGAITAAVTAVSIALTKLYFDYQDLKEANEEFNRSVVEGTNENINSINKFFEDYKKELKNIAGASQTDQQKMWERMQEEIEKTIRNAQDYIDILNEIADTAARIKVGEAILQQQQTIEQEVKDLANKGIFDLGGGFAQDDMAEDLKDYDDIMKDIIKDYGNVGEAAKHASTNMFADRDVERFKNRLRESEAEIDAFVEKLGQANLSKIMGNGDFQTQLANIRNFYSTARDYFLATEKGSKIGYEGQALLNHKIDQTIASLGRQKNLFKDMEVNGKKYSASQIQSIEANRTAWEKFFSRLNAEQKKVLNYAVKTGQTSSDAVKEIWDTAAKEMAKSDLTAFYSIQEHIAQLRNTPDIVLNIVYKERTEKSSDLDIRDYEENLLTPKGKGALPIDEYLKEEAELTKKYGSLKKKEGEDRVEWAKRVNDVIKDEKENLKAAEKAAKGLTEEYKTQGKTKLEEDKRYQSAQKDIADAQERIKAAEEVRERYKLYQDEKNKKGKQKDPILEALKLEISLVEKLRGDYDKLTKAGESQAGALATIHDAYGKTIKQLNAELKSFKLPQLDIAKIITGKDPKKQLDHFQKTLDSLIKNGLLNIERSKEVEAVLEKLKVSAKEYDFTELSKGIEKELGKLKEKIELGAALDAEPQLGNLFAQMYGFNSKELPRTFSEIVEEAQYIINKAFHDSKKVSVDIEAILDKDAFEKWAKDSGKELDSTLVQSVQKVRDYLVETQRKMISDTSKEYDKLMERYSEYQFRLIKVDKDTAAERLSLIRKFAKDQHALYVRDAAEIANEIAVSTDPEERERLSKELSEIVKKVADGNEAVIQIAIGIDRKEAEEKAQIAFDEFTKNPEWKTAIGDLEGMTHKALRTLIKDLEDFIKTNKKLTPKQINQVEKTISKLHKQIRKNNPFAAISDAIEEAENRTKEYEDKITEMSEELATLEIIPEQKRTKDQQKRIVTLTEAIKKYKKEIREVGEIDMGVVFADVNNIVSSISSITSEVTKLLDAIGGTQATEASKTISNIVGNMEAAGRGAQIGSSFGGYGAAIGAVAGGLTDLATRLANEWSGNEKINEAIERSVRSVKRLEMAYANLEHQMKESYGEGELYAKKLLVANKKVQLAELQKQLTLEQSRKNKNRDRDKELDLQQQINDLTNDLNDDIKDIVNSLLGISSVKDAASTLVDSMIDAFKSGEDYMQKFADSFEDMIDHMIAQAVMGQLISDKVQKIVDFVNSKVNVDTEELLNERTANEMKMKELEEDMIVDKALRKWSGSGADKKAKEYKALKERNDEIDRLLQSGSKITPEIVEEARKLAQDVTDETKYEFDLLMEMFGVKFGQKSNLSNLQQGIQGITEDTANALEAYMNGVSQQVYAHTELLTEIRDAVVAFNGDATLGVQSQMLLQLQNNYILMQTMQALMENWTVPSGNGIRVELMS